MKVSLLLISLLSASLAQAFLIPSAALYACQMDNKHTMIMRSNPHDVMERREQVTQAALALGLGVLSFSAGFTTPMPARADSTGKYSTKQTAKKRYLPRIRRGVKAFQDLSKTLDQPATLEAFNKRVEDDLGTAMSLYGASTRIGELPDPKSRSLEKEVEDFIKEIKNLAKGNDAKASYAKAKELLEAYLAGAKLEKLGSKEYDEAQ